ncbi:MAG: hypothetical protein LBT31_09125 [Synergistaceae bacterium]|nr:hypothetical protein [Synergistaceae bacterium]
MILGVLTIMVATNVFLANKVSNLAYDIEQLNEAYRDAVESMRGFAEAIDSLPPLPPPDEDEDAF